MLRCTVLDGQYRVISSWKNEILPFDFAQDKRRFAPQNDKCGCSVKEGEELICPYCEADLMVVSLDPVELDWAYTPPAEDEDRGKAALTEFFLEVKNDNTPVMVERIVNDIDEIVRLVRFPGWQQTTAGEREVRRALRKTLFKYKLHREQDLFDRAYGYIRQYY